MRSIKCIVNADVEISLILQKAIIRNLELKQENIIDLLKIIIGENLISNISLMKKLIVGYGSSQLNREAMGIIGMKENVFLRIDFIMKNIKGRFLKVLF